MHTPPPIALLATLVFVFFLFRRDIREKPDVTRALWLPLIWMLLICSRPISQWLGIMGLPLAGPSSDEEGSPLDALIYFALIAAATYVLTRRQVTFSEICRNNGWLVIFLIYCLVSVVWADSPFVAFKRWIKVLGHPIMALVVLTEPDFPEALTTLMKRCAYVIVPVSILLIKYYPDIARRFDPFSGEAMNTGIAGGKNMLGADCLIVGSFFAWHLMRTWRTERSLARRRELFLIFAFIGMIAWLFQQAHSATSEACLLVAIAVMFALGMRVVNKRLITIYVVSAILVVTVLQLVFGISDYAIALLNRNPTLTDRTVLWANLMKVKINPIIGTGFESFWMGDRPSQAQGDFRWEPNEAHNGYLETYLSLGIIGLSILIGTLIATFFKARRSILTDFQLGRFRLGFLAAVILYNWTEASFRALHPVWFPFYLIAMESPKLLWATDDPRFEDYSEEELMNLHSGSGSRTESIDAW